MNNDQPDPSLDLDARLRAAFAPPADSAFREVATRTLAAARPPAAVRRPLWPWLLAAAAALLIVALLLERPRRGPQGQDGAQLGQIWATAYADAKQTGFASSCCEPQFDLARRCKERFSTALEVAAASGISVIGCYCTGPDGGAMILLTERDGVTGCVCVLPRERDPGVVLPKDSGLQLARRELGPLVLYSLAPEVDTQTLQPFSLAAP